MLKRIAAIVFCLGAAGSCVNAALAEDPPVAPNSPAKPKIYALVAAMGDQFVVVNQVKSVGSHMEPYRRTNGVAKGNILNRFVLHALDHAIASTDANSRRVYLSLPSSLMEKTKAYDREDVAIAQVIEFLRKIPDRSEWDTIVVATPAYKAFEINGIAARISGVGMFMQLLNSDLDALAGPGSGGGSARADFGDLEGPDARSSDGKLVRSSKYYAPFSYIEVWVIDPRTLAVVDRQKRFDNVKLWDPLKDMTGEIVLKNFSSLVERSVYAAVTHSEILTKLPVVEVGNVKEGKPDPEDKKQTGQPQK